MEMIRASAILTNGAYILNVDCDHYFNNSKALKEAMCFMMDPAYEKTTCYVQFPQRFYDVDLHDQYANRNMVFFDIIMKGVDGIQGPFYVGTGCCFNRQALYGFSPVVEGNNVEISLLTSQQSFRKRFVQCPLLVGATVIETTNTTTLKQAISVISCDYEDETEWGEEIGWMYGSVTEDVLTGFRMHARGWISIYCKPSRPAFLGCAPINLSERLGQVHRWSFGSVECLLSRHCPIWYGLYDGKLRFLERLAYINNAAYPFTSIALIAYCVLPAICLINGKFISPEIKDVYGLWFIMLLIALFTTVILELQWSDVSFRDWWRNEQFWVIGGTSANLFAVFQVPFKFFTKTNGNFSVTSKADDQKVNSSELHIFKWTCLLVPPTIVAIVNLAGIVFGVSSAIIDGYESWGPLIRKMIFAIWVMVHLYPFLQGLLGRENGIPTSVILCSIMLAILLALLWIRVDPFMIDKWLEIKIGLVVSNINNEFSAKLLDFDL